MLPVAGGLAAIQVFSGSIPDVLLRRSEEKEARRKNMTWKL